jgi:hypothetical protein
MTPETNHNDTHHRHIIETIIIKTIGYGLILAGVVSLVGLTYHVWDLYHHPQLAERFAITLQNLADEEQVPMSLLKLAGWQLMLLLLLTTGKISVWLIESGKRLLD